MTIKKAVLGFSLAMAHLCFAEKISTGIDRYDSQFPLDALLWKDAKIVSEISNLQKQASQRGWKIAANSVWIPAEAVWAVLQYQTPSSLNPKDWDRRTQEWRRNSWNQLVSKLVVENQKLTDEQRVAIAKLQYLRVIHQLNVEIQVKMNETSEEETSKSESRIH